jgi:hypothetical protein
MDLMERRHSKQFDTTRKPARRLVLVMVGLLCAGLEVGCQAPLRTTNHRPLVGPGNQVIRNVAHQETEHSAAASKSASLQTQELTSQKRQVVSKVANEFERFLITLKKDARGTANWNNAAIVGTALGGAIGMRQGLDNDIRKNTARHSERWGHGSQTLGKFGEPQYQIAALAVLGVYSYRQGDEKLSDFSDSMFSAFTITGLSTLVVKGISNTDRPSAEWNKGQFGFPSFHVASSFAAAAVIDDYYGPHAGLPAYALAGLIGWSRIDERDHDLSDVFFGAALGYVIGKSVSGRHLRGDGRVRLLPFVHPTEQASGLMLDVSY